MLQRPLESWLSHCRRLLQHNTFVKQTCLERSSCLCWACRSDDLRAAGGGVQKSGGQSPRPGPLVCAQKVRLEKQKTTSALDGGRGNRHAVPAEVESILAKATRMRPVSWRRLHGGSGAGQLHSAHSQTDADHSYPVASSRSVSYRR